MKLKLYTSLIFLIIVSIVGFFYYKTNHTTMAALLGGVPVAMGIGAGTEFRQPIGAAVIGELL